MCNHLCIFTVLINPEIFFYILCKLISNSNNFSIFNRHDKDTLPSNYQQVLDDLDLFFKTYFEDHQNVSELTNSPEISSLDIATAPSTSS